LNSEWAILKQFFLKSGPTDPGTDYAGYNDYGTLPKTRSYSTLSWDYRSWGATLGYTHINHVDDLEGGSVSPYNTFDIQFRANMGKWSNYLRGVEFDIGCNNFTNRKPPLDTNVFASPPFDASAYSFFGRIYYADLRIKF
jgi:outer membrane receptor protein involved in Fe transport